MTARQFTAALVALILGAGTAVACGRDGDRESVNQSNQGEKTAEGGGNVTTETGPTTLGSTGTQPTVTQGEGGSE